MIERGVALVLRLIASFSDAVSIHMKVRDNSPGRWWYWAIKLIRFLFGSPVRGTSKSK